MTVEVTVDGEVCPNAAAGAFRTACLTLGAQSNACGYFAGTLGALSDDSFTRQSATEMVPFRGTAQAHWWETL